MSKVFLATQKILAIGASLALAIFLGASAFVRPLADDYCISARLIVSDPLQAALYKYLSVSNRF